MPLKLDHTAFQVADINTAIDFYQNVLGLKLMSKSIDEQHGEAFAFFELEGGNLELLQNLAENDFQKPEIKQPFCPHVALGTEDLDQLAVDLQQRGIPIIKGPLEIEDMVKWLYIADPDNNIIEFVQWLKTL